MADHLRTQLAAIRATDGADDEYLSAGLRMGAPLRDVRAMSGQARWHRRQAEREAKREAKRARKARRTT